MEKQVKAGRAKSIGLSNFNESQIQNILNNSEIKPSNLQVFILLLIKPKYKMIQINKASLSTGRITCIHAAKVA